MTRITNNEVEKFRLNFSNHLTRDAAPLKVVMRVDVHEKMANVFGLKVKKV